MSKMNQLKAAIKLIKNAQAAGKDKIGNITLVKETQRVNTGGINEHLFSVESFDRCFFNGKQVTLIDAAKALIRGYTIEETVEGFEKV